MSQTMVERATYTVEEVARLLGVSRDSVYRGAQHNEIPHRKLGTRYLFPRETIDRWLAGEN